MRVAEKRWGEITIKKQGIKKNHFDITKSFSIMKTPIEYSMEEIKSVLEETIDLTEKMDYEDLMRKLRAIGGQK